MNEISPTEPELLENSTPINQDSEYKSPPGSDIIASGYTSPVNMTPSPMSYHKLPFPEETYLAYVVAIRDPLNLHLDIYWTPAIEKRYRTASNYDYTFVSEELPAQIYSRSAYLCHLKGVEIVQDGIEDFTNMKEAYVLISKQIARSGGWVLISVSDIDVYRRILVDVYDLITRKSLNSQLLNKISDRSGQKIAQNYIRPVKNKKMFLPTGNLPKDYHIIFPETPSLTHKIPNSIIQI